MLLATQALSPLLPTPRWVAKPCLHITLTRDRSPLSAAAAYSCGQLLLVALAATSAGVVNA